MRSIPRPRFRLLTLLIAVTALCVWLAVITHRAHRQRDAIAALAPSGAWIVFDDEIGANGDYVSHAPAPGPSWLRRLAGDDYFRSVVAVWFRPGDIRADLELFAAFPKLRSLDLRSTNITDARLAELRNLHSLESLDLDHTKIAGTGFAALQALPSLSTEAVNEKPG